MFKTSIALAAVALAGTAVAANIVDQKATISLNGAINLDTGVVLTSAGGDLAFTGSSITFQGKATGFANATGQVGYNNITLQVMQSFLPSNFITAAVTGNALAVNEVIVVKTNGGNYAKCLITALSGASLSITFTTYDVTSGPAPTIRGVLNNSSLIPNGFPNSGFSGSALIVIQGNNMATPGSVAILQDSSNGLPATLNGASGFITAGGKNYTLVFYYAIPTQLAAVVPASVPAGPATLTITFNGQSAVTNVTIVATAFGIDVYNGNLCGGPGFTDRSADHADQLRQTAAARHSVGRRPRPGSTR